MRPEVADELERLVLDGGIWDAVRVETTIRWLAEEAEATGDPLPGLLSRSLASLGYRLQVGPVVRRMADDVDAVVYPRLWKVVEAIRDGLPDGEARVRIEVLQRRLARTFAEEPERDAGRRTAAESAPPADRPDPPTPQPTTEDAP